MIRIITPAYSMASQIKDHSGPPDLNGDDGILQDLLKTEDTPTVEHDEIRSCWYVSKAL